MGGKLKETCTGTERRPPDQPPEEPEEEEGGRDSASEGFAVMMKQRLFIRRSEISDTELIQPPQTRTHTAQNRTDASEGIVSLKGSSQSKYCKYVSPSVKL